MYVDLNKLKNILGLIVPSDTSIGIHGIGGECTNELFDNLFKNGIKNNSWGGVLSNFEMKGTYEEMDDYDWQKVWQYCYHVDNNGNTATVIAGIPSFLKDSEGNKYFIGKFPKNNTNFYAKGKEELGASLPINQYVDLTRLFPSEFIVGILFTDTNKNENYFFVNKNYIGYKGLNERNKFFEQIKEKLLNCGAIDVKNIDKYIEQYQRFNPGSEDDLFIRQLKEIIKGKSK